MFRLFLFCVFFVLTPLAWARDAYVRQAAIDIQHYRFEIEIEDKSDRMRGRAKLDVLALQAYSKINIDLGSLDASGKGMQVESVSRGSQMLPFTHQNDVLSIAIPERVQAGIREQLEIVYHGVPRSGLNMGLNKFGERVFFADNWPDHGRQWLPSIDHPSDKASVEFLVTAPEHYAVVANGLKVEESSVSGGRKMTHWREEVPLAVKVMVIGVARFAMQESAKLGDIAISSWVFPGNREAGFSDYSMALHPLRFFQDKIAVYPYKKLANVQSKTRFGGLENANTIFYFENSVTGKGESEALIAHEIAHQWFGNSATENDWHHVWLSEGFATYFTMLYIEEKYGRESFVKRLQAARKKVQAYHQKERGPIVDVAIQDPKDVLSANTYEKAAWVLHMLRQKLGDDVFWRGVRLYYTRFAGKNALSQDVQKAMEDVSGQNLELFFQQWLYQAAFPRLVLSWTYHPDRQQVQVELRQTQASVFHFPLEIELVTGTGKRVLHTIKVDQREHSFSLPSATMPTQINLDPEVKLMFEGSLEKR